MTILFILSTIFVARMLFRWRMYHAWAHGDGCHRRRRFRGGPIDLGAPDEDFLPRGDRFRRSWQRWQRDAEVPNLRRTVAGESVRQVRSTARPPRQDVAGALELNQRQQQLFEEVMERARNWVEPANLADALAVVGHEPFDRARVETLVGSVEISDDFEHFHHSLTAEQRAKLREVTASN